MKRKLTNKQKAYMVEYQKNNLRRYKLQLNANHDTRMIEYLDSVDNVNAYLKSLVQADMDKNKNESM